MTTRYLPVTRLSAMRIQPEIVFVWSCIIGFCLMFWLGVAKILFFAAMKFTGGRL